MKYTNEQIIKKAEQVLKDIKGEYYIENLIEGEAAFEENKEIAIGLHKGERKNMWSLLIKSLFDNVDILYISDETGEPLYLQNFNYIYMEIAKNGDGKYYRVM